MENAIEAHGLSKSFGRIEAVRGVSLAVRAGEIYGLLGPNGSGKTTLMRMLVGLVRPGGGHAALAGTRMPDKEMLRRVGYMTQAGALYGDLSVRENVEFFGALCGGVSRSRVDELLDLVGLADRAGSPVHTLSGGMKQRASLACALAHRPQVLLLDEPTVGVDPQLRAAFWQHFRSLAADGAALLVSSHVMDEAERCDRLGFMRGGLLLAEGTPSELRTGAQTATLEEAFLRYAEGSAPSIQAGEGAGG